MPFIKDELDKVLPTELIKVPTIEKYWKMMDYEYWNYSCRTILYLREYEAGLQGIEYLLKLTNFYDKDLKAEETRANKYKLWFFYLQLLDKSDRWEEYLETVEKLRQDPSITSEATDREIRVRRFIWRWGRRKLSERTARNSEFVRILDWLKTFPDPGTRSRRAHISNDPCTEGRRVLIRKKIDLQKAGKSVKRLMHKSPSELTDEEYRRRIEVLKFWFEYPKKWEEWAKQMFSKKAEVKKA